MHVQKRDHIRILVRAEQTSEASCSVTILLDSGGAPLWFRERNVPLIDCDVAAVERTAIEVGAAIADHLARWPNCTMHCKRSASECPACATFLARPMVQPKPDPR